MKKQANILDWPQKGLSSQIWNEDQTLKSEVKQFILDFISSFAKANNFKDTFVWITQIKFVGSLTTNLWNAHSDLDIHCEVDLSKFVEIEHPEMTDREASEYLDGIRKQVDQVKAKIPGTEHPLEIFFENEFTNRASQQFSGTYSVLDDKWAVAPHIVGQDFDISVLHPELLNLAKETAAELDESFGDIKQNVQDIKELAETIYAWPEEQRELLEKKLQKRLDELEKEIRDLVVIREDVAEKRKHYEAISEQEVRFKYLQKYYYMHVLTDLKTLLKQSPELSVKDIPVVENIMQQANLKEAQATPEEKRQLDQVLMVDVDDTIFKEESNGEIGDPIKGAKEVLQKLKDDGYTIVLNSHRANTEEGRQDIKNAMDEWGIPYDEFWMGDKPLAFRYIDNRAVQMTTWSDVLKKIEKAENHKAASLSSKYWLDPQGRAYKLDPRQTHPEWILNNLDLLKREGIDTEYESTAKISKEMFSKGWVRISTDFKGEAQFYVELGTSLNSLPSYVEGFVDKYYDPNDSRYIIFESKSNNQIAYVANPFPSLQKVVNKALRQPVAATLSKKEAAGFNPYEDDSLKRGPAYAVYIGQQEFPGFPPIKLYNIFGNHERFGSTVSEQTLKELGIPIREQEKKAAVFKIGDVVKDKSNNKIGIIKAIEDTAVILESI